MNQQIHRRFEFGPFLLDTRERVLLRDGHPIPLRGKVFDTLAVLVASSGRALEKEELMRALWPDTFVEEGNLTQNISRLRKALGEDDGGEYIETLPGRGYRFASEVKELPHDGADLFMHRRTRTHIITTTSEDDGAVASNVAKEVGGEEAGVRRGPRIRGVALAAALAAVAALAAAFVYLRPARESRRPETAAEVRTLAVLPFQTIGGPDEEYLGMGLADTLITRFGNLRQVVVRPTSSVRKFAAGERDVAAAGREMGVDAVLDGSVHRAGDRVRVTVQLLRVTDGAPLWSEKFDANFTDIFSVEDSITEQVARALTVRLDGAEQARARARFTDSTEAYRAYLKGLHFFGRRSEADVRQAIGHFEEAVRLDPAYALPHDGLAKCHLQLFGLGEYTHAEAAARVGPLLAKAVELGEESAEVQVTAARVRELLEWDWAGAERAYRRAIELNPNHALAHSQYATLLAILGREEEALAETASALDIDPLSPGTNRSAGVVYNILGRHEQGLAQLRHLIELDPKYAPARFSLGVCYTHLRRYDEAAAAFEAFLEQTGGDKTKSPLLAFTYAMAGRTGQARTILTEMLRARPGEHVSSYDLAVAHAGLGEAEQAFARLEEAYREHHVFFFGFKSDPWFAHLRQDPRHAEFLRRLGLKT